MTNYKGKFVELLIKCENKFINGPRFEIITEVNLHSPDTSDEAYLKGFRDRAVPLASDIEVKDYSNR